MIHRVMQKLAASRLLIAWILMLLVVIGMTVLYNSQGAQFIGVVETREIIQNVERAVTVKNIPVIPGQRVARGALLMELDNPDLDLKMSQITSRLEDLQMQYKIANRLDMGMESMGRSGLSRSDNPLLIKIRGLKKELDILKEKQKKMVIYAEIPAIIGEVNYKAGERVTPFSPIITLFSESPSIVRGYVHENINTRLKAGDKLRITSMTDNDKSIIGQVLSVSSRYTQFPERINRLSYLKIWGREVIVKIPEKNTFLIGEKVLLQDIGLLGFLPIW